MRRLALAIAASIALVAAIFVSPIGASATTSNHSPTLPGPHSGVKSPQLYPFSGRMPAAAPRTVTLTCDAGFHAVSSPSSVVNNYLVSTSAVSANDVWAVGNTGNIGVAYDQTLAEHWDGTSWTIVPTSNPGPFHNDLTGVVAISTNDVWVVGAYTTAPDNSTEAGYAQHWNGSSWTGYVFAPTSVSVVFAVAASSTTDVWAVGAFVSANTALPLVEHWNGSSWSLVPAMNQNSFDNEFFAVSAVSSTDVWAVGEATPSFGATPISLAEHWDGSTWTLPFTPNSSGDNEILGVAALGAGHAVGVGFGNFISGSTSRQSESWDLVAGGSPTLNTTIGTGLGSGDNALLGIARSGGAVWVVGYQRPGGNTMPRLSLVIPATWDAGGNTFTWGAAGTGDNTGGAANTVFEAATAVSPYAFWSTGYQNPGTGFDQTLTESYCANHFNVTAPATSTAGSAFSLTVTVQTGAGATVTGYRGTVHFTSIDGSAVQPANYTFLVGDNGTHTFAGVILNTPGNQTITVTDLAMPFTTPGIPTIRVLCRGTCQSSGGTAGGRGSTGGPPASAAARSGASQSPSGTPGPRLPRLGSLAEGSSIGTSAAPATIASSASPGASVTAVAPQSAPQTGGAAITAMSSDSVQAPAHLTMSLAARNEHLSRPPEPSMWYLLLLVCLLGGLLTIGEFRRRRFKEKSNVSIQP